MDAPALEEREVVVTTDDGEMGAFVVRPADDRVVPVVVFLMDAPGKRPLLHDMARRIAANGHHVLLPNLYYRTTDAFQLDSTSRESFERMVELMSAIGNRMVGRDVGRLIEAADADPRADVRGRVERYWGTEHGFAFDDRPAYDRRADDRHWDRLLDLFARNLR